MVHFFRDLLDRLLAEKNQVASGGGVLFGWAIAIYVLLQAPGIHVIFTVEFLVKTAVGVAIAVGTAVAIVFAKDFYNLIIKPKIFKKYIKNDNEKRA